MIFEWFIKDSAGRGVKRNKENENKKAIFRYSNLVLERLIPIYRYTLISDLLKKKGNDWPHSSAFSEFSRILNAVFKAAFQEDLDTFKYIYALFNPDRDMITNKKISIMQREKERLKLFSFIEKLLERANFDMVTEETLQDSFNRISSYGLSVTVDFRDFKHIKLYSRGIAEKTEWQRTWKNFFLKPVPLTSKVYRRLFMVFEFTEKAAIQLKTVESERLYVKLFKDIPVSDLEMLFPNTRVRMLLWDKIKLAVTGGGGTIGGITAALSKIGGTTLNPVSIIGTLGGLAAVLWRQLSKLFYQRTKYMATLARHLYFYNLDNNFGAITYLLDMAESEEFKEAVLAYYFLLDAGEKGMSEKELDKAVEDYIFCTYDIALDFDVADGIDKLNKHGLIRRTDSGNLTVTDLSASLMLLYERWNGTHSL